MQDEVGAQAGYRRIEGGEAAVLAHDGDRESATNETIKLRQAKSMMRELKAPRVHRSSGNPCLKTRSKRMVKLTESRAPTALAKCHRLARP